jgi:hypothetical protein
MKPKFKPGRNIAMKVPLHEYRRTVLFLETFWALKKLTHQHPMTIDQSHSNLEIRISGSIKHLALAGQEYG